MKDFNLDVDQMNSLLETAIEAGVQYNSSNSEKEFIRIAKRQDGELYTELANVYMKDDDSDLRHDLYMDETIAFVHRRQSQGSFILEMCEMIFEAMCQD